MSFTYTDYHHHQFYKQFLSPLPMPSPTSCWYPKRQDVQFGYSYPDNAVVSNLETRLDNTDRFVEVLRPPARPQPDPDPSYHQHHYSGAAMNTHLSGGYRQQPHYLNPNIDGQPLYPCYQPDEYEQRADNQLFVPQHPPYTGFDSCRVGEISAPPLPEPLPHPTTDPPYDLPCPPLPKPERLYEPAPTHGPEPYYTLSGQQDRAWSYHMDRPSLPPLPIIKPTSCWGPPPQGDPFGPPQFDQHQPLSSPMDHPTCWDPQGQPGYPAYEQPPPLGWPTPPPTHMESLDRVLVEFQPQQPQLQRYQGETEEDRCYGDDFIHAHLSELDESLDAYGCGYAHELREQKEVDSSPSSLEIKGEDHGSSLEVKVNDLSALPEEPNINGKMDIQSLVGEHKVVFEMKEQELEVGWQEKSMSPYAVQPHVNPDITSSLQQPQHTREQLGMPFTDAAAHVEHPFASIAKLESRRDDTDRYVGGLHAQPRPPPAPPNGQLSYAPTFQPDSGLDPTVPSSHTSLFLEQLQSEQVVIVKEKLSELHLYSSDVSMILNGNYGEGDSSNSFRRSLLNKFDKEAEVVDAFGEWSYSKSIRICNCLVCITKKGNHQPTAILIDMAKKIGLSFVSEVLLKGAQDLSCEKTDGVFVALPRKEVARSYKEWRKENYFNGKMDLVLHETNEKSNKTKIEFFFTLGVIALRQLCAILEDLHTFDPGGDTSPKLMVATLFVLSWFPP